MKDQILGCNGVQDKCCEFVMLVFLFYYIV